MKKFKQNSTIIIKFIFIIVSAISINIYGQAGCDPTVPTYIVDLTGMPNGTYISPPDNRDGNCCGTSAPDKCIQFIVTLDPMSNGLVFSIASGAIPPGALFYQIDCGPPSPVGSAICLVGVGPHYITFCKPGNNTNTYQITALAQPTPGPDVDATEGCTQSLYVQGLDPATCSWTSIAPGPAGTYNSYLSCTSGCDSVTVTPGVGAPAFIDYQICGAVFGGCFPFFYCDTLRVNVNPPLTSINTNLTCFGSNNGAIDLTALGTGPFTYSWSNGATTEDISSLAAGLYTVTVTSPNGCTRTLSTTITQPTAVTISGINTPVSCLGGANGAINITPAGGTAGYTFLWSNGSTTEDIAGLVAGSYTVTVTDANGCTNTYTNTVTQPATAVTITGTVTPVACFGGSTGMIDITPAGGTPGYTYSWTSGQITQDIAFVPAGSYTVTVTDLNGCTNTYTNTVTQPASAISSSAVSTNILCFGANSGAIDLTPSGGTPGYTYSWTNGAITQDVSALAPGSYTVTITDVNGCTNTLSSTITQPAAPLTIAGAATNVLCFGNNTGSIDITPSGGTAGYTYLWSNGAITQDIASLTAGGYTVTVTDANGCTNTYTNTITQPAAALTIVGTMTPVACFGASTGMIDITPAGGTPAYTYSWTSGQITQDIAFVPAGSYTVTVTDINGCTNTYTNTVTQPASAISSSAISTNILCFGANSGAIDLTPAGGTPGYTYSWTNGAITQDIASLAPGSYTVTITDMNGCTNTLSSTITQPAAPLTITGAATNVLCFGNNTGSIDITPSGGTAGYTYLWSNGAITQDIASLTAGGYTVTVTDANGCTNTYSNTITQPAAALTIVGTMTPVACFGASTGMIDITPAGGTPAYTYSWTSGQITQDIAFVPAGSYTVTVTDMNGCTNTYTNTVTQPATALSSSAVSTNILCFGANSGAIDLTPAGGTPGYTYSWTNGAITQDVAALAPGSYTVTITDVNGCTNTLSSTITQPAAPLTIAGAATNVLCFGNNTGSIDITPTGGTAGYTYLWSNGAITQDIAALTAGGYTVTVTDANGCTNTYSNTITQPASALTIVGTMTPAACFGGSTGMIDITPAGGTPAYTYSWTNGQITQDIAFVPAGSYTVTVTDINGCTNTYTNTVTQPASAISSSAISTNILCFGANSGAIDLTPAGGTPGYTYSWTNGAITQDVAALAPGSYTVTITDMNGCTNTLSSTITQPAAALSVSGTTTNINCFGNNTGSIDITPSGGTPGYTYLWSNASTTQDISALIAGPYSVIVTDANGCTNSSYATIITQPAAALTVIGTSVNIGCFGGNNGSIDITPSGGTPAYTYLWSNGATTQDLVGLAPGLYTLTITDANGCINNSFSATINQPMSAMAVTGSSTNPLCYATATGAINITPSGGTPPYSFSWSNGADIEDIVNLISGNYSITITDANGCNVGTSFDLIDPPAINLTPTVTPATCAGIFNASFSVEATGGSGTYTYSWSNGGSTSAINNISAGNYTVTVTDANGCTSSLSAFVPATIAITINLDSLYFIWLGEEIQLNGIANGGTGLLTYNWTPPNDLSCTDCPNPIATPTNNSDYTLTVTDENGCLATAGIHVDMMYALYVPNTFTPNGDGTNDIFNAHSESVREFNMRIFDRWGEEVFVTQNIEKGWEGFYKGLEAKQDVYVYRIEVTFLNGKYQELIGQVNLVR